MMRNLLLTMSILAALTCGFLLAEQATASSTITRLTIDSAINPVVAKFISEQLDEANSRQDAALLIELNTPGGLDTAMRKIIQAELGSNIPVIV